MQEYPAKRNLDGIYHRVMRNGKAENVCMSDMTGSELMDVLAEHKGEPLWMRRCVEHLVRCLREVGDEAGVWGRSND